nr:flagellar basal body P-ring formation chaperone FlgA [uncultured Ferrimonas sp.]
MKRFTGVALGLFLLSLAAPIIAADPVTSLVEIQSVAEDYVSAFTEFPKDAEVVIKAKPLDKRLRFPQCQLPLSASAPTNRGAARIITVKVSCSDADGWSLYVPVQAKIYYQVVVTSVAMEADTQLDYSNLRMASVEAKNLRGNHFNSLNQLVGAKLVRRANAGQALKRSAVCQICRGDSVTIFARTDSFELKTSGEAISSGNVGDTIRVKNNRSARIINAKIIAVGEVEVQL